MSLLSVKGLVTSFDAESGTVRAVDGVSFDVPEATTVGLVGESGCGKSVTSLSLLRLIESPGRIDAGEVIYKGKNLLALTEREMQAIRGNEISMVFQEPMTSLNPVYTVGAQIVEAIRLHQKKGRSEAWEQAEKMLGLVGIPTPRTNARAYPHQLSGGQRQRVMIAMALACQPSLLIADEPTTALDVTIQAQILELLRRLQEQMKMSILLITHDLGVVAENASSIVVMYAGRIVESGPATEVFKRPRHPYTRGLLASVPEPGKGRVRLTTIEGAVPDPSHHPDGCKFAPRCALAQDACREKEPEMAVVIEGHTSRCLRWEEL